MTTDPDYHEHIKQIRHLEQAVDTENLLVFLQNSHIAVVRTAARALGRIGGLRVIEPLLNLLSHESLWVRRAAVEALGDAGEPIVIPELVNLLDELELHELAREALIKLKVDPDFF